MGTPPVFIVVCSNTSVSKLVYDWIARLGEADSMPADRAHRRSVRARQAAALFSNVDGGTLAARAR